jgi:hypothetical protein
MATESTGHSPKVHLMQVRLRDARVDEQTHEAD